MRKLLLSSLLVLLSATVSATDFIIGQTYKIFSGKRVLTVENASLGEDSNVVVWTETEVNAQRWVLTSGEKGDLQFVNAYSGKSLCYRGSAVIGSGICQKDRATASASANWKFVPVGMLEGMYYMVPAAAETICVEASSSTLDGASLVLSTKKEGVEAVRQMWKIEAVSAQPNTLTAVMRDAMMEAFKKKYYHPANPGHVLGNGGWWGDAEMFETVLDAYEATGNVAHRQMFDELYRNFIARNKSNWLYNDFNDDITWMVLACVRGYLLFGTEEYLNRAKENFDAMYKRAAILPYGTLLWNRVEKPNDTNSCIDGPAEIAACYLAIATGDESYYTKAKNLYAAQRRFLYKSSTGHVYDSLTWEDEVPVSYNNWASTYNQGTFLGAAVMLYNHFKDEQYKEDAKMIMNYTLENLCDQNGIVKVCQTAGGDFTGFKGILMRYVRRFMVDLCLPEWNDWLNKNAFHAYNNRNSEGVICSAWLSKTPENYIFEGEDFNENPFGPSTAISVAFNAYIDGKSIVKQAFEGIEAEHFDYLKGVSVVSGTDNATSMLGSIQNGAYTGYHNVNFGTNLAKSIEVRLRTDYSRTKIEIHLDSPTGPQIGLITVPADTKEWQTVTQELTVPVEGLRNVYLVYTGPTTISNLVNINSFKFTTDSYFQSDLTDLGGTLSSSFQNGTDNVDLGVLIDNKLSTKFQGTADGAAWFQYHSPVPLMLKGYALASADNDPEKDPKSWKLQASDDGVDWVDIDAQSNQTFGSRYQKNSYDVAVAKTYTYFRLSVTERNGSASELQLAEWQLYGNGLLEREITADGGVLTAQYGDPSGLTDKKITSDYKVDNQSDLWIEYQSKALYKLSAYTLTSSTTTPDADPKSWVLYGSEDGKNWTVIDRQAGQKFLYRNTTQVYPVSVNAGYTYFRLHLTGNNGSTATQLAEWQLMGDYYFTPFFNDITSNGGVLTASNQTEANTEALRNLTDNDGNTSYTCDGTEWWIQYQSTMPVKLRGYALVATDDLNKVPKKCTIQGSNDGVSWTKISEDNMNFSKAGERKKIDLLPRSSYTYFRVVVNRIAGNGNEVKLGELELYGTGISATDLISESGEITGEYEGASGGEGVANLVDKSENSKYCVNSFFSSAFVTYESPSPLLVSAYSITAANDYVVRDPRAWRLEGSENGTDWELLDIRKEQSFIYRYSTLYYPCNSGKKTYSYFRLTVDATNGADMLQFAEWQLLDVTINEGPGVGMDGQQSQETICMLRSSGDYLYIDVSENACMRIYNMCGQLERMEEIQSGISEINIKNLAKGLYVVTVQIGDKISNYKIIK